MLRRNESRLNVKNRPVRTGDLKGGGPKQPPLPLIGVARSLPLIGLKALSHYVKSCLLYPSCMSKYSARYAGHVGWLPFPNKYRIVCKESMLKIQIKLSFVTSIDDSHYILLIRYIYGA